jgi:hypothetical protein
LGLERVAEQNITDQAEIKGRVDRGFGIADFALGISEFI